MSIRVMLVGAGNACRLWLPVVSRLEDVELRALVDVDESKGRAMLDEHGVEVPLEHDVAAAAERHRPQIVVDLTPPASRETVAGAAFAAGCDVIAEKPMAESLDAAGRLIAMADAAGRRLAVMQNHRFHPALRAVREAVAAGTLGEPVHVDCQLHRSVEPFGRAADMDSPLLADMAIHAFDGARALLGRDARRVRAHELRPPRSGFAGATVATCTFELDGGALFTYRGSWSAAGLETPWFGDWRVDGTLGAARWQADGRPQAQRLVEHTPQGPRFEQVELRVDEGPNDHPAAVPALLRQMASGAPLETPGADNIRSLAMVLAALESVRTGAWADVPGL
jgi:predicted dehydrogenase